MGLLEEADLTERKAFLRSFIKRIEINKKQAIIHYNLPLSPDGRKKQLAEILPIVSFGGPFGTVPELLFEKNELIPMLQQLLLSYHI